MNNILNLAELTPMIKFALIAVGSVGFTGIYMIGRNVKTHGYDTITDLKKRSKSFNKMNYQENKK